MLFDISDSSADVSGLPGNKNKIQKQNMKK